MTVTAVAPDFYLPDAQQVQAAQAAIDTFEQYIQRCQNLFEQGSFQGATRRIAASSNLRHQTDKNFRMGQADWMMLATMRESEHRMEIAPVPCKISNPQKLSACRTAIQNAPASH